MKVVLAGAFGKLGSDILRALCASEHELVAADAVIRIPDDVDKNRFKTVQIDVTKPETLKGLCDGADVVITTIGLTGASTRFNNYDIDYKGNLNLIKEAKASGVKQFAYISVINADKGEGIPMVHSKYLLEEELKNSGLNYVIYRPTGYFYDIAHVFWPMIKKKSVQLLKVKKDPVANVIDTKDFARFILETMCDNNKVYNVGGTETYTYREIAEMFYNADGVKNGPVKTVPAFMMDVLANLPKIKKQGKSDVLKFSKFTLLKDCYGDTEVPGKSFKAYIAEKSYAPIIEAELKAKEEASRK
ncbi:MAG: NAD(P)H-binding protein [Lachnospiraceae bacterium]|nr:NAD(P)H-binding protein [Lachnospiraceae bacterium]